MIVSILKKKKIKLLFRWHFYPELLGQLNIQWCIIHYNVQTKSLKPSSLIVIAFIISALSISFVAMCLLMYVFFTNSCFCAIVSYWSVSFLCYKAQRQLNSLLALCAMRVSWCLITTFISIFYVCSFSYSFFPLV